jgi:hypothetical protein
VILCIVSMGVSIAVLVNLALDVNRGYSPNRCSPAAVVLLAAFAGPLILGFTLISYFAR